VRGHANAPRGSDVLESSSFPPASSAIGEIGDKTQLLSLVPRGALPPPWPIVAGTRSPRSPITDRRMGRQLGAPRGPADVLKWVLALSFFAWPPGRSSRHYDGEPSGHSRWAYSASR